MESINMDSHSADKKQINEKFFIENTVCVSIFYGPLNKKSIHFGMINW